MNLAPSLCLYTASHEPSGMGEQMLTLAAQLRGCYRIAVVCAPFPAALSLLERARTLGLATLALDAHELGEPLRDWLRAQRMAIFHCHAGIGWEGHTAIQAAREAGVPALVRTEHLPDLLTDPCQRATFDRTVRIIDRLVCVSEGGRASFLQSGVPAHKLQVVHNGITPRPSRWPVAVARREVRARLGLPPGARLVLTVGRLTEQKGHRFLLEAVPAVIECAPDAYFLWVGVGPLERELRQRIGALELDARVRLLGRCDDVPDLLAAVDLLVLPSLFEGLPLAVLEAMAAGLPVVGTRVCGTVETIRDGETGRLVEARDPSALAAAILEILAGPDLAARWGAAGRSLAEREFSATRMARDMAAIYDGLLHGLGPASYDLHAPSLAPARAI